MRRPNLSTGTWLFCSVVAAASITPAGVFAAVNSHVAIGNVSNATTATVDPEHQLLTTTVSPRSVVRFGGGSSTASCVTFYRPPAGMALVITSVTFDIGTGTAGTEALVYLAGPSCAHSYDVADTTQAYESQQHVYPAGLPVDQVRVLRDSGHVSISGEGYLIPADELPPNVPAIGNLPHGLPHH
jgi:hypothetical protein